MFRKILISLFLIVPLSFTVVEGLPLYSQTKTTKARTRSKSKQQKTTSKKSNKSSNKPTTSQEAKRRQEAARKEIRQTEEQIRANESKVKNELAELGKVETDISATQIIIDKLNKRLTELNNQIAGLEENISKNENELKKLREEYLKAVKKMRVAKKNKSDIAFIFSSENFNQALRRMRYLKEFSSWRTRQSAEIEVKVARLTKEKEDLSQAREEQKNSIILQNANREKLELAKRKQESIIKDLKANGAALQAHLKKKQAEANELGSMISQLIAQEQETQRRLEEERRRAEAKKLEEEKKKEEESRLLAENKENSKTKESSDKKKTEKTVPEKESKVSSTDYANARKRTPRSKNIGISEISSGNDFQNMKGRLPNPVNGKFIITSHFGRQNLPDLPDVEFDNPGIDAEVDAGASAVAVYNGNISGVYLLPGYNTVVIINHGGYYTVYGNISSPYVKVGDQVEAGQRLGILAANEDNPSYGAIHFEVWRNREKQNPEAWLK